MNLIEDIAKYREDLVKRICRQEDKGHVFLLEDVLGKADLLADLVDAWLNDNMSGLKILTGKRIELELKQCETMLANPEPRDSYVKHWIAKRKNLLLLQKLVKAWNGDSLHNVQFAVVIQE